MVFWIMKRCMTYAESPLWKIEEKPLTQLSLHSQDRHYCDHEKALVPHVSFMLFPS